MGNLIAFDEAARTPRLAAREAARAESRALRREREGSLREEHRQRWERDLETWPRAFHRPARKLIESRLASIGASHVRRIEEERAVERDVALDRILQRLANVHFNAACVRASRRTGTPGDVSYRIECRGRHTDELLAEMWLLGERCLNPKRLRPLAAEAAWRVRDELSNSAECREQEAATLREQVECGTVQSGRRRGQPYGPRTLAILQSRLAAAERRATELREELQGFAGRDPLRVWLVSSNESRARWIYRRLGPAKG